MDTPIDAHGVSPPATRKQIRGIFLGLEDGTVTLRLHHRREVQVPANRLFDMDQAWLQHGRNNPPKIRGQARLPVASPRKPTGFKKRRGSLR